MIRLGDAEWERIRNHFPEENIPDRRSWLKAWAMQIAKRDHLMLASISEFLLSRVSAEKLKTFGFRLALPLQPERVRPRAVPIRSLHLMIAKMGISTFPHYFHHNSTLLVWCSSYDPNRITFPFRRSFGLPVPLGCPGEGE